MIITWQGEKIKIDNLDKAQELFNQLTGVEESSSSREQLEIVSTEEQTQGSGSEEMEERTRVTMEN